MSDWPIFRTDVDQARAALVQAEQKLVEAKRNHWNAKHALEDAERDHRSALEQHARTEIRWNQELVQVLVEAKTEEA